jgi:hypothetical protein
MGPAADWVREREITRGRAVRRYSPVSCIGMTEGRGSRLRTAGSLSGRKLLEDRLGLFE